MHSNTPFLPHAVSLPHPFRSSSIDMGGVGGVQRREEEENANNAFFALPDLSVDEQNGPGCDVLPADFRYDDTARFVTGSVHKVS